MAASFAELFKKYRLKSEFETLSEFGRALAEKGYLYEDSIFSHWQKGTRVPSSRELLLVLITVFSQRGAMHSEEEANSFLASVNQGYLTQEERKNISSFSPDLVPFQSPREIANFTGRRILMKTLNQYLAQGSILLLYGPSGVGKTALAIHLGHMLKEFFPDGVLWYNVENTDPMEILLSIAYTFHENISAIQDVQTRASFVRSLLANKKVLLILDNAETNTNFNVLLPNSSSSVIITSQYQSLPIDAPYEKVFVPPFNQEELFELFLKILPQDYIEKHRKNILDLAASVENLPLATHIYAKKLAKDLQSPKNLLKEIKKSILNLQDFFYENKDLYVSINVAFTALPKISQKVFLSLGIFEGKDFSLDAIAKINNMSLNATYAAIQKLVNASLLEEASKNRYRLHLIVKQFIRVKTDITSYLQIATAYYTEFLRKHKRKNTLFYLTEKVYPEKENILFLLGLLIRQKRLLELLMLWKYLGELFFQTGEWEKIGYYGYKIYKLYNKRSEYYSKDFVKYVVDILIHLNYFTGNIQECVRLLNESENISKYLQDEYLIQFINQRKGKIYQPLGKLDESTELLIKSLPTIEKSKEFIEIVFSYKFLSEVYFFKREYKTAMNYLEKAYAIAQTTKDIIVLGIIFSMKATLHFIENDYKNAERYSIKGIKLEKIYNIRMGIRLFNYLILALIEKEKKNLKKSRQYLALAEQENAYLNIGNYAPKMYPIVFLLEENLKKAGYFIFK